MNVVILPPQRASSGVLSRRPTRLARSLAGISQPRRGKIRGVGVDAAWLGTGASLGLFHWGRLSLLLMVLVLLSSLAPTDGSFQFAATGGSALERTSPNSESVFVAADNRQTSLDEVRVIENVQLKDERRDKELRMRVTFPDGPGPWPLIIWSHGMYGDKDHYQPLTQRWAAAGYVVIQPTHSDSLSLVSRREALKILAEKRLDNTQDWPNRPIDIQFIMDSLEQLEVAHPELRGKIDKTKIGVGGHSFGAVTTQLVAGTKPRQLKGPSKENYSDDRPRAFVAISPNGTGPFFQADAFAAVQRPLLIISGTNDAGRNGEQPSWRREPFDGAGPGDKYLGWVVDAHHSFGGIAGDMGRARQLLDRDAQPSARQVEIVARSVLVFWDAYLKEDQQALAQLRQPELLFPAAEFKWEHK